MTTDTDYQPGLHRLAVLTAAVALALPITVGALVTTFEAGMAFPDWPTSDGHGMFAYPWLKSIGDKFLEHGHRLAGIVIGLLSIVLAGATWSLARNRWVRWMGPVVLLGVVCQGLLGGLRVLLDAKDAALLHGQLAAWVFATMSLVALFTSRGWIKSSEIGRAEWTTGSLASAIVFVVLLQIQFALGGLLRHHGRLVHEHLGFAFLVLFGSMWLWYGAISSRVRWLQTTAWLLIAAVTGQILLGLVTFVARFGFGNMVATPGAPFATWTRTGHVLLGMLVWMLGVIYLAKALRVSWLIRHSLVKNELPVNGTATAGGVS